MSINGVEARQVALRLSLALHARMAVSGLIMPIFLPAHILGNPKNFQRQRSCPSRSRQAEQANTEQPQTPVPG